MSKRRWVQAAFAPRGVAVVGASGDPSKLAWGTLRAVTHGQKRRPVVAIDRNVVQQGKGSTDPQGRLAFPNPHDVPPNLASSIDLAVLVCARDRCLERMRQCINSFPDLKAVNVVSGGFRETTTGEDLELQIVQEAHSAGIRLIGPNSVGSIDSFNDFASMFLRNFPRRGDVSLISQSGGVCGAVVELLSQHPSMGMSKVLSLGNAADVGFIEALKAVGEDPHTRVVLLYLEGLGSGDDGDEFVHVAKTIAADKPILALKAGSSNAAARAISSHTGALAGNTKVYEAALRAAGIVQATSLKNMLEMAQALSCRPRVAFSSGKSAADRKYRVAVVTNAGGPGALAVDALVNSGAVIVPCLPESLQSEILRAQGVHALSATSNPIDLLGGATTQSYRAAIQASLGCADVDAVVSLHVPTALSCPKDLADEMVSSALDHSSKPVVGMFVSNDHDFMDPALAVLNSGSISAFVHAEGVGEAFRAWKDREDRLYPAVGEEEVPQKCFELSESQTAQCGKYLSRIGKGWVLEHEARALLELIGVEQPKAELVPLGSLLHDVLAAADRIGYPVVLKREDHVHKSRTGGVALNLQNPSQVQAAFQKMFPEENSSGAPVLVCEDISVESFGLCSMREFLVGTIRDEVFGPAVCFGTGGLLVEIVVDVEFALSPQTRSDTLNLLSRARLSKSEPPLDLSVVADNVERIAALARAFPNIAELDINPLMVGLTEQGKTRVLAADVKFRLV